MTLLITDDVVLLNICRLYCIFQAKEDSDKIKRGKVTRTRKTNDAMMNYVFLGVPRLSMEKHIKQVVGEITWKFSY